MWGQGGALVLGLAWFGLCLVGSVSRWVCSSLGVGLVGSRWVLGP
jgi:hypothetical protein